ncbi:MAG: FeoA family protein [candidate division WOR-3 bacterium]|nr:FeoA family protein [candidate division WOR-3 bacterium]
MEKRLSEMEYEEKGVVKMIEGELREKVAGMGIRVGKKVKMITKQPMRGPIVVLVDEARTSLGLGIAKKVIMEVKK